jgi:hypothetical protein
MSKKDAFKLTPPKFKPFGKSANSIPRNYRPAKYSSATKPPRARFH